MKKIIALLLTLAMALSLVACGGNTAKETEAAAAPAETAAAAPEAAEAATIKVAAIETAYGSEVWEKVAAAFTETTGINVELTTDKNLEDVISGPMQNGEYPDVVHLATGRAAGLTEQIIKANGLHELTNVLSMTVPGEDATVSSKITAGFTDTALTNPYGDGKTYLAPMFYSPCGLFYNAKLFEEKGWTVPTTWDEMWELGDKAKEEGISLFTYPTAGYFDAFLYGLMYTVGGVDFFDACTNYAEGAWEGEAADKYFEILDKLADYTHPNTPAQANGQDFTKNQLMVMTNDALFMPNGTWIVGEMADAEATLENDFAWGMTALPAVSEGGDSYGYTFFEQAWIPAGAEHIDEAEQFVAFLYSDKAVEIFAEAGAIQPVNGVSEYLSGDNLIFYTIYDNGAKACMGSFATYSEIPGVDNTSVFFEPINSLVSGTMTIEEYAANVIDATNQMRENLIG